jgi:hypothetical protein
MSEQSLKEIKANIDRLPARERAQLFRELMEEQAPEMVPFFEMKEGTEAMRTGLASTLASDFDARNRRAKQVESVGPGKEKPDEAATDTDLSLALKKEVKENNQIKPLYTPVHLGGLREGEKISYGDLAALAADPQVQAELRQIAAEFAVTEHDGLDRKADGN